MPGGFNIESYRNANKVKLVVLDDNNKRAKTLTTDELNRSSKYEFLLSSPLSFSFGDSSESAFGVEGAQTLLKDGVGKFMRATGNTWQGLSESIFGQGKVSDFIGEAGRFLAKDQHLDLSRKFLWNGTSPLAFNIACFLKTTKNPIEDVLKPLDSLLTLTMPKNSSDKLSLSSLKNFLNDAKTHWEEQYKNKGNAGFADEFFWGVLSAGLEAVDTMFQGAYLLSKPEQYEKRLFIISGPFIVGPAVLKGVSMNFTNNFYEYEGVNYPDAVQLNFNVETLRSMSYNTQQQPFVLRGVSK